MGQNLGLGTVSTVTTWVGFPLSVQRLLARFFCTDEDMPRALAKPAYQEPQPSTTSY
jgi:hypothetical protein